MSKNNPAYHDKHSDRKFPSLNLLFDLTKEGRKGQSNQVNALDIKANFIFVSATALVSVALVLQSVVLKSSPNQSILPAYCLLSSSGFFNSTLLNVILILVLISVYMSVIITAYLSYKNRKYSQAPDLGKLYEDGYLLEEEYKTKEDVYRSMLSAYIENEDIINSKVSRVKLAFILLLCEVIILALYVMFHSIC